MALYLFKRIFPTLFVFLYWQLLLVNDISSLIYCSFVRFYLLLLLAKLSPDNSTCRNKFKFTRMRAVAAAAATATHSLQVQVLCENKYERNKSKISKLKCPPPVWFGETISSDTRYHTITHTHTSARLFTWTRISRWYSVLRFYYFVTVVVWHWIFEFRYIVRRLLSRHHVVEDSRAMTSHNACQCYSSSNETEQKIIPKTQSTE